MRLGVLHLAETNLAQLTSTLTGQAPFSAVATQLVESDAMHLRQKVISRSVYDDCWFFARFGIEAFARTGTDDKEGE